MPDVEAVKIVVTLAVSHVAITTSGILLHLRKDCIVKADVTIGSGLATRGPILAANVDSHSTPNQ